MDRTGVAGPSGAVEGGAGEPAGSRGGQGQGDAAGNPLASLLGYRRVAQSRPPSCALPAASHPPSPHTSVALSASALPTLAVVRCWQWCMSANVSVGLGSRRVQRNLCTVRVPGGVHALCQAMGFACEPRPIGVPPCLGGAQQRRVVGQRVRRR